MTPIGRLTAAAVCAATVVTAPAWAAAPDDVDTTGQETRAVIPKDYALDTEMVVRNWVLCTSQTAAEALVEARQSGVTAALEVLDRLQEAKSCGQFPQLRVILREAIYESGSVEHDARIFGASVNLGGAWASAFVIYGSIPAE